MGVIERAVGLLSAVGEQSEVDESSEGQETLEQEAVGPEADHVEEET